jgi:hypothetical protein
VLLDGPGRRGCMIRYMYYAWEAAATRSAERVSCPFIEVLRHGELTRNVNFTS